MPFQLDAGWWGALVLLLLLPAILKQVASAIHALFVRDRTCSDSPSVSNAGDWLLAHLASTPETAAVTLGEPQNNQGQIDAFWPGKRIITLQAHTYYGTGSASYHIAAHEFGHAYALNRSKIAARLFPAARWVLVFTRAMIFAFVCLSLLSEELVSLGMWAACFFSHLAAHGIILTDEAIASRHAIRVLGASSPHKGSMQILGFAWAIYASGAFGRIVQAVLLPVLLTSGANSSPFAGLLADYNPVYLLLALTLILARRTIRAILSFVQPEVPQTLSEIRQYNLREKLGDYGGAFAVLLFIFATFEQAGTLQAWFIGIAATPPSLLFLALVQAVSSTSIFLLWGKIRPQIQDESKRAYDVHTLAQTLTDFRKGVAATAYGNLMLKNTHLPMLILWWIHWTLEITV